MNSLKSRIRRLLISTTRAVSYVIYYSGIHGLYRRLFLKNKVTLIFYHDIVDQSPLPESQLYISENTFLAHLRQLKTHYSFTGINQIHSSDERPNFPLVLTFDGYSSTYLKTARRLSETGIPATFYLITEPIQNGLSYWRHRMYYLSRHVKPALYEFSCNTGNIRGAWPGNRAENMREIRKIDEWIEKKCPDQYERIISEMASLYGLEQILKDFNERYRPLTTDEVGELASIPGITVGSHSHTHPRNMDISTARIELETSKRLLEKWTNKEIVHYAYPTGWWVPEIFPLLAHSGYQTAVITGVRMFDANSPTDWPYMIPRYGINDLPYPEIACRITGLEIDFKKWTQRLIGDFGKEWPDEDKQS